MYRFLIVSLILALVPLLTLLSSCYGEKHVLTEAPGETAETFVHRLLRDQDVSDFFNFIKIIL